MIGDVHKLGNTTLLEGDLWGEDLAIQLDFNTTTKKADNKELAAILSSELKLRSDGNASGINLKSSSDVRLSANGILSIYVYHKAANGEESTESNDIYEIARLLLHKCSKIIGGYFCVRNFNQDINAAISDSAKKLDNLKPMLLQMAHNDDPITSRKLTRHLKFPEKVMLFAWDILNYQNCLASVYCSPNIDNGKSSRLLQMVDDILRSMLQGEGSSIVGETCTNPIHSQVLITNDDHSKKSNSSVQFCFNSFADNINCSIHDIALALIINEVFAKLRFPSQLPGSRFANFKCSNQPLLSVEYDKVYLGLSYGCYTNNISDLYIDFFNWVKSAADFWRAFDEVDENIVEKILPKVLLNSGEIWSGKTLFDLGVNRFTSRYTVSDVSEIIKYQQEFMLLETETAWSAITNFLKQFSSCGDKSRTCLTTTLIGCMAAIPGETPLEVALYHSKMLNSVKHYGRYISD